MQNDAPQLTIVRPETAKSVTQAPQMSHVITDSYAYFSHYARVLAQLPYADIERVIDLLYCAYQEGNRVFLFGNGGSAALASHFACDLGKGTSVPGEDKRFHVLSLTDNVPLMTAWANDTSYDLVFAEQLRNFIEPGDIAFGISGSGRSANVLIGLQVARKAEAVTVGLTGFKGGKMVDLCDFCMIIPSDNMQIIEDLQLGITHAVFTAICHRITQEANPVATCSAALVA